MPHITIECSHSLVKSIDFKPLVHTLHDYIAGRLGTKTANCKTRVVAHEQCYIGDDFDHNLFMHLTIKILPGRSDDDKTDAGQHIFAMVRETIVNHVRHNVALSVELLDLSEHYFK